MGTIHVHHMSIRTDIKELPPAVWVLFFGTLVNRFGTFVLVFLVLYVKQHGYTIAQAGLTLSAYGIGGMAAALAGGYMADRLGRRNTIVFSMLSGAITLLLLSRADSLQAIVALTVAAGFTAESYRPAAAALLTDLTRPAQRLTAFAVYRIAINLGAAVGPAVGGLLAERSFTLLFVGDAATSILFGITALLALPNRVGDFHTTGPRGGAIGAVLGDTKFLLFLLASTLSMFVYVQSHSSFPLQIQALGFSTTTYGLLMSLNGFIVMCVELPLTSITGRYAPRAVMAVGLALTGVGFGIITLASGLPLLVISVVVWTMGEIIFVPVAAAYVANVAPPHMRGRYQGAWGLTFSIGMITGPAAGTALFYRSPVGLWGACVLIGMLAAWLAAMGADQPGHTAAGEPRNGEDTDSL